MSLFPLSHPLALRVDQEKSPVGFTKSFHHTLAVWTIKTDSAHSPPSSSHPRPHSKSVFKALRVAGKRCPLLA